jgi:hypothetical protein
LIKALEKKGIHVFLRQNDSGLVYDITYFYFTKLKKEVFLFVI